jgi:hypothetical protein
MTFFVFLEDKGFRTERYRLTIVLTKDDLKRLSVRYPEYVVRNEDSDHFIVSGAHGNPQWTIQLLPMMELKV